MNDSKIINDPIFGFIKIPHGLLLNIVEHPLMQRLTRIKQLGLTSMVYPSAQHTRFQHSLGAFHLMSEAITSLTQKGIFIFDSEAEAVEAAILMHDIGHGPFSHVLEHTLIKGISHEDISLLMMEQINREMKGELNLALKIFKNEYPKKFLHQLISSQLDMDRLDYLRRDSFFTGVTEGNIGSARIIKMLDVVDDNLVVNSKGLYSIENYLIAYDIDVFRVYPKQLDGNIKWMNILEAFNAGSVKLSQKGLIGRALVVSSNFNRDSLNEFLSPQANTILVSSGTFITPDRWQGRFDIGRCGREVRLETDLNILNQAKFIPNDKYVGKLDNTIVLRTSNGDIAKYSVPSRLGDNILIIGIPTQYFVETKETIIPPNAELVVLISPRIIKIVRPFEETK